MSNAMQNHLLAMLEQAARDEVIRRPLSSSMGSSDREAARHAGVTAPNLARKCSWGAARVRYNLRCLAGDGKVVEAKHPYAAATYWPVGLAEKLQRERRELAGTA